MGLISAVVNSATGVLGDQWKEYFYCEAIPADVLVMKARKKNGKTSVDNNIISNGSVICVADGQCAILVDQGKVTNLCAEPGEWVYDQSTEPSIFDGGKLGDNIKAIAANIGKRVGFGGTAPKDQRLYYFNTKEIIGNKYGTPNPVPFRVVDERAGIDIDISVRCFGEYSYKITNPVTFYANVCGNVTAAYTRAEIDSQLKSEFLTALQPAFARVSEMGIRYSALPGHTKEFAEAMRTELTGDWYEARGIEVAKVGISSVKASEEDEKMLKEMQRTAAYTNAGLAAAATVTAQNEAMKAAASNAAGAGVGFMNLNMAGQAAGGMNAASLFQMAAQQQAAAQAAAPAAAPAAAAPAASADSWTCPSCGTAATGKFCPECGAKKPAPAGWTCPNCGTLATGKFCPECGTKKPEVKLSWTCPGCGTEVSGKFCPECGMKKPE